jgi:uncharacterized protein DUF6894
VPRYYFRLTDGNEDLSNHKGMDLPGPAAAREEAFRLAHGLKNGTISPGRSWDGWFVKIVDEHDQEVDTVPIADLSDEGLPPIA